ncbi:brain tumor protein-like isoform X2 [Watersipora subatra]|uniref:brain tumor protein-like isoform X2 n=1 Tax=Watersipora subatra TaxID=2589382 RepID=UPI00355C7821
MNGSSGSSPNYTSTNPSSLCGTDSHHSGADSNHCNSTSGVDLSSGTSSSTEGLLSTTLSTKCNVCFDTYTFPKVLECFHTFCQVCLEKQSVVNQTIQCPDCQFVSSIPSGGLSCLPADYAINAVLEPRGDSALVNCTGCKSRDTGAIASCHDCANYLCPNCVTAHKFMHCFEGHRVQTLEHLENSESEDGLGKAVYCEEHKVKALKTFCKDCDVPLCELCESVHKLHNTELLAECSPGLLDEMRHMVGSAKVKANHIRSSKKGVEHSSNRLVVQFERAQAEVKETFAFYKTALEDRQEEILKELESTYKTKQVTLRGQVASMQSYIDRLYMGCEFIDKLIKHAPATEALSQKKLVSSRVKELLAFQPDDSNALSSGRSDLEFVSNFQAIQVGVKNTFGYVRHASSEGSAKPQPIARPIHYSVPLTRSVSKTLNNSLDNIVSGKFGGSNTSLSSLNGFSFNSTAETTAAAAYEAWPTTLDTNSQRSITTAPELFPLTVGIGTPEITDGMNRLGANFYPPKSQIKRQKMIYHCKFGEFGVLEGQFTEPSGVAVNAQNDIIVADTNNHRIQIFDKEGRFKFQFGECGKRDGQLLYPNRVAVVKQTGDIVVTERSPTHQVQIFNQYGQFVRKFGANVLQHPRGVTVDHMGRIIIVECKVMRVIIFDLFGNMLQKFSCSKHLEFPNGVVVNDQEEIFISDNRAHCVKVFNYQGLFTRQIGGEGISNYPIGVGINSAGDILIADNHNNFNLTVFNQDGQIQNALESKVKHAQCFDVALLDDNSIVLASKDYRLYIYRYAQGSHVPVSPLPYSMPEGFPSLMESFR